MIGPLHLAQAPTHMGYSVLCLCCCDDLDNVGGDAFQPSRDYYDRQDKDRRPDKPVRDSYIVAQTKARQIAAKQRQTVTTPLSHPGESQPKSANREEHHKTNNLPGLPTDRGGNWGVDYRLIKDQVLLEMQEEIELLTIMIVEDDNKHQTSYRLHSIGVEKP